MFIKPNSEGLHHIVALCHHGIIEEIPVQLVCCNKETVSPFLLMGKKILYQISEIIFEVDGRACMILLVFQTLA